MTSDNPKKRLQELFSAKQFDVEHALNMYANSFVTIPASAIYENALLESMMDQIRKCHIYLIGLIPKIDIVDVKHQGNQLVTSFEVLGNHYDIPLAIPEGLIVEGDIDSGFFLTNENGDKFAPDEEYITSLLRQKIKDFNFEVLYIGQAFGEGGSRSALDRLRKHETLQKISLQGIPPGYVLTVLMLEIMPANRMFTMFNPWSIDKDDNDQRINKGLNKLFNTNEAERITLYEASLIRYFQPRFNKEFKNSFPSTNMKVLADCYEKDINSVIAEICIDVLPFTLFSRIVPPQIYHIAHHDLHTDVARKVFFQIG